MNDLPTRNNASPAGAKMEINGLQKAATLLLAAGPEPAARILRQLGADEVREVTRAAARLGSVHAVTIENVIAEFTESFSGGFNLLGDVNQARALLADAIPSDQVNAMLFDTPGQEPPDVWTQLSALPEASISTYLISEPPRTISYILSRMEPPVVGRILPLLPRGLRNKVLCLLISPPEPTETVRAIVEATIRAELLTSEPKAPTSDNRARVASIINSLDPDEAEDAMKTLSELRPADAEVLKSMMFSFTDLPSLSARARALLFDKISADTIVLALRGMNADFCSVALSSMASRSRRLVEGELANGATPPPREIAKARKQIVDTVLEMAQRSEIDLSSATEASEPANETEPA